MAVSKTLLSPRGHSRQREGKRRGRSQRVRRVRTSSRATQPAYRLLNLTQMMPIALEG
jgi:hypothetical protein